MHMYRYRAFGIEIASAIKCPELAPGTADPVDLTITVGAVPTGLGPDAVHGRKFEAVRQTMLLKTIRIADFLLTGGREIRVMPKPAAVPAHIRAFLLGWAMGAVLQQRGRVGLHGSAVATAVGAQVFCGPSGAGKSTLAHLLAERGYPILDDNIAALSPTASGTQVEPGVRRLRLWDDAITAHPSAWQGRETVPNTDRKFTMAPPVDRMQETALPLATVHVLERGAPRFAMEPVRGAARYALLRQQIFCPHFLPGTGASAAITSALIVLADRTPVVRVSIPDGLGAADLADRLSAAWPTRREAVA